MIMRVCVIVPYLVSDRGSFEYSMTREFCRLGIDATIITSNAHPFKKNLRYPDGWQDFRGLKIFRVNTNLNFHQAPFISFDRKLLEKLNPDFVFAGEYFQPLSMFTSKFCKQFKIPFFFNQHMYKYPKGVFGFNFRVYNELIGKFVWKNTKKAIAISQAAKSFLKSLRFKKEIDIITGGVDTRAFKPGKGILRELLGIDKTTFLILCVSRLSPEKGIMKIPVIAEATRNLNVHYVIIGNGSLKDKFYTSLKGLSNVDVISFIPHNQMPKIYPDADLYIAPSNVEVLNYSVLEAMSCGVPVLASNVGGMRDIINGSAGFLLPSNDIEIWIEKIRDFFEKRIELKRNKIRKHAKSFDWKSVAKKTVEAMVS